MPDTLDGYENYRIYFLENKNYIFIVIIAFYITDGIDTLLKGRDYFFGSGMEYPIQLVCFIALSIFAIAARGSTFHALFAVGALLYQVSFVFRKFSSLS